MTPTAVLIALNCGLIVHRVIQIVRGRARFRPVISTHKHPEGRALTGRAPLRAPSPSARQGSD